MSLLLVLLAALLVGGALGLVLGVVPMLLVLGATEADYRKARRQVNDLRAANEQLQDIARSAALENQELVEARRQLATQRIDVDVDLVRGIAQAAYIADNVQPERRAEILN